MTMQTWKPTELCLLQVLGMTIIGSQSYVCSQALGDVRHRPVDVFLWRLFSDSLQGDFQLSSLLRLRLEFTVLCHRSSQM